MAHLSARQGRFEGYLDALADAASHQDRRAPLRAYVTGICLPGERKSVEPMAARVDPRHVSSRHQSMHHFVAKAEWSDEALLGVARQHVLDGMQKHGGVEAWIVDDTAYPKKGKHSVGVARQYCGVLGKQDNCQAAVSVSLANEAVSVPAAYRLYLPEAWANDPMRRSAAGVPGHVEFHTKLDISLGQVDALLEAGVSQAPVIADAGYGSATEWRDALTKRGLAYAVGIRENTAVWSPGNSPAQPRKKGGRGRPPTRLRRNQDHQPLDVLTVARGLPESAWQKVAWREGTKGKMESRFARLRIHAAHRDYNRADLRPAEWLMMEWPAGEEQPTKYWLSTLPPEISFEHLVRLAKMRWRIERDYQELKDEFGLDHYEGRGWRGFHHHATLCIAAYAFVAAERARLSPPGPIAFLQAARLPRGFRPRGSAGAA